MTLKTLAYLVLFCLQKSDVFSAKDKMRFQLQALIPKIWAIVRTRNNSFMGSLLIKFYDQKVSDRTFLFFHMMFYKITIMIRFS